MMKWPAVLVAGYNRRAGCGFTLGPNV